MMQMSTSVQLLKKKLADEVFWACNVFYFSLQLMFKVIFHSDKYLVSYMWGKLQMHTETYVVFM
jgi:hypothetical protein